jgi:hypothetical protein
MANRSNRGVFIRVDTKYFENFFEPERIKLQEKIGLSNLSQQKFTEYLIRSGAKLTFPKIKKTFAPKIKKRDIFNFDL